MTQTTSSRATARTWLGLAILALPTVLVSMDLTVLHLAVPFLSADLRPTRAAAAGQTLGAAVSVAGNLPVTVAGPLLAAARAAFTHGMHVTAWVCAGVTVVAAGVLLRRSPARPDTAQDKESQEAPS